MKHQTQKLEDRAARLRAEAKKLSAQARQEARFAKKLKKLSAEYEDELRQRLGEDGCRRLASIRQQLAEQQSAAEDDRGALAARKRAEEALDQLLAEHGVTREEIGRISHARVKGLVSTPGREIPPLSTGIG